MSNCVFCYGCGNCVKKCKICGKPLKTKRKSEDKICDECIDSKDKK